MTFSKLGTDTQTGQLVYLPKPSRLQGLYIIGIQGTGKSGLIENLIMQDIDQQIGVCVLDPHGELIDHVLARLPGKAEEDKVILLDLADYTYPFGLNLIECPDPTDDGEIVKTLYQVLHVFEKAYGIVPTTPLMYDLLYHTVYTLIANPGYTMIDIRLLLTNEACRKKLAANVPNSDIKDFWTIWDDPKQTSQSKQQDDRKTILNKMNDFLHVPLRHIVGQSKTTINLQDIMDTGNILLVKLSRRLEQPSNLIGSIIIAQLLNAAYARPTHKRKQFHLYADEFQNFATEDFATLLEEARKFGIGTTIAHQNRGQLNSANSQLETDLKDRSRSVGNLVVFKINSKDADDLAGEFKITPQAAWEEEVEKEWVEVLRAEWYERVEEEVVDGTEPILTPVKDVVNHLLNGGSHPMSDVVNQFAISTLKTIGAAYTQRSQNTFLSLPYPYMEALNTLFYTAMTQRNSNVFFPKIYDQTRYPNWVTPHIMDLLDAVNADTYASLFDDNAPWKWRPYTTNPEEAYNALYLMWTNPVGSPKYHYGLQVLDGKVNEISMQYSMQYRNDPKQYNDPLVTEVFRQYPQRIIQGRTAFLNFFIELKQVVQALATEPIREKSGFEQPRKRKQITYHTHPPQTITHPRKTIMHPQRTYQDVRNELATQLVSLPNFSARVKIGMNALQNPGKKCLSCRLLNNSGAVDCTGCGKQLPAPNEFILTTIKPAGAMNTQQLEQRNKRIQARNLQQGYLRDRKTVEAEITQRQTGCSGVSASAQLQPQQPSPQLRHVRQVPVQGYCPNCGKSNPTGSKFCNQCGTKLT